jgi:peroxiredoxin
VLLAVVFATAAAGKLVDQPGVRQSLADFGMPPRSLPSLAVLLPLAEAATAISLLVASSARWGGIAAVGLLLVFTAGVAAAMVRGRAPDCHCFGQLRSGPTGWRTLIRNALLAVLAAFVVAYPPGEPAGNWLDKHPASVVVALVVGGALLALAQLSLRLRRENQALLRDLDNLARSVPNRTPGPPIGSPAPRFALAGVDGLTTTRDALLERGHPVALVFLSRDCSMCSAMLPSLARWQATLADRLTIAPVVAGSPSDVRQFTGDHGLEDVLVDEHREVFRAYDAVATPSGLIVTADGRIASRTMATTFVVESLIRRALHGVATTPVDDAGVGNGASLVVERWSGVGAG